MPDQMQGSTPCTEWNVQNLIIHNIRVAGFAAGVLQENIQTNPMDVAGAIPGGDPVKALDDGLAQVMEIIKAVGSVDTQINTPFGDMTRGQFLITPTWDLPLHRWDLAKDTTMDAMPTQVCFDAMMPQADGMREMEFGGGHIFGPRVSVPDNSSIQD